MNKAVGLLITFGAVVSGALSTIAAEPSPESVVQAQLEAYNARNIDAFIATYADDVKLFELPEKLLSEGTAPMRDRYGKLFKDERLHATIVNRIVMGNTVVDHERVRLTLPDGPGTVEAVAIYEVRGGKITAVWFRYGSRKVDGKPDNS